MKKPVISVLMPVYNAEEYLSESIASILNQTYPNFEFLILDDGSTDSSKKIIEAYAKKDSRIKVFSQANQGLTKSLIYLSQFINGIYIARHDADDLSASHRFEKQMIYFEKNPHVALAGTASWYMNAHGKNFAIDSVITEQNRIKRIYPFHSPFVHASLIMKKEAFDRVKGYRSNFRCAQDYDISSRLLDHYMGGNINEPLYSIRWHSFSVTAKNRFTQAHLGALASFFTHERANYGTDSYCNSIATKSINEITKHTDLVYIYYLYLYHYYGFSKSIPKTIRSLLKSMPQALCLSDFYTYPFHRLHKCINDKLLFKRMYG